VIRKLLQSPFARNVAVLAGGTAFAQGVGVLALPVLTRFYTPEDFGVLGAFVALLGMISVVSALRYEIAIPLPEDDQEAANLLVVSLICVVGISALAALLIVFFGERIAAQFSTPILGQVLWMLPIGVLLTGAYSVFQFWAARKKAYPHIARTRIEQAVGGIGSQLGLGWAGVGAVGLVIGQVISNGAGFIGLARRAWTGGGDAFASVRFDGMCRTAYVYRRYPMYSSVESLANMAGLQLPLILIATLAGNKELGFLMLVMRILQAPMSLVGSAVAQVYLGQAASQLKSGRLMTFTSQTLKRLFQLGLPPMLLVAIAAPWATPLIFGASWARAGELIVWMAPFFFLQFLSSPIAMALHALNKQRSAAALQISGLCLRGSSVLLFPGVAAEAFAVSSAIFYMAYLLTIIIAIKRFEVSVRI